MGGLMNLQHLTNKTLLADTKDLVGRETKLTTQILWHIKEIDKRRLYSDLRYASLWEYVTKELGYSEGSAHRRISAARALVEMPELEQKLNSGELNLTNLAMVLSSCQSETVEVKREILTQIENKTTTQVKQVLQARAGIPAKKFKLELDEETYALLLKLKALRPQDKNVAKFAIQLAITAAERQRFKKVARPKLTSTAEVKRKVFARDQHRCSNCKSHYALEIDHIKPKALGGGNEEANLRVLCHNCNQRARQRAGLTTS